MDFFYRSPLFEPYLWPLPPIFGVIHCQIFGTAPAICPYKGDTMKNAPESTLKKLVKNQKGQGVMEYVIISSLVGIVCITAVKGFGDVIKKRVEDMKESIVENIKT